MVNSEKVQNISKCVPEGTLVQPPSQRARTADGGGRTAVEGMLQKGQTQQDGNIWDGRSRPAGDGTVAAGAGAGAVGGTRLRGRT